MQNSFPSEVVQKAFRPKFGPHNKKQDTRISLPYIPNLTFKIARFLKQYGIQTVSKKGQTIGSLLMKNSPSVQKEPKDIVYKIPCQDCNKFYIGQTSRYLSKRISEHQTDLQNQNQDSATTVHSLQTGHTIAFTNAHPLETEQYLAKRLKLESLYISTSKTVLNRKPETEIHPDFIRLFNLITK